MLHCLSEPERIGTWYFRNQPHLRYQHCLYGRPRTPHCQERNIGPTSLCVPPTWWETCSFQCLEPTLRSNAFRGSASVLHTPHQLPNFTTTRKLAPKQCISRRGWACPTSNGCQIPAQPPVRSATYGTLFRNCSSSLFTFFHPSDECSWVDWNHQGNIWWPHYPCNQFIILGCPFRRIALECWHDQTP